jgi:hypothetical protein
MLFAHKAPLVLERDPVRSRRVMGRGRSTEICERRENERWCVQYGGGAWLGCNVDLTLSGTSPPALLASSEGFEAAESIHLANAADARMGNYWQKKGVKRQRGLPGDASEFGRFKLCAASK